MFLFCLVFAMPLSTCLKRPHKKTKKLVFQTNYRLVKVLSIAECFKGSILQYF